jgi:hypothetical protein
MFVPYRLLFAGSQTADNLQEHFLKVFDAFGIKDKVKDGTVDNGRNYVNAFDVCLLCCSVLF